MPQVVPAVVAAAKTAAAAWTTFATAHPILAAGAKIAATAGVSHVAGRMLAPKVNGTPSIRATEVNVRDPASTRQIIWGQRKAPGVFYPVGVSGTNNEYLHLIIVLATHECEELGDVYFNDEVVPLDGSGNATGTYAGFVRIKKHLGAYNQTVDTALQADLGAGVWTNDHRGQGVAYLYIRLKNNPDLFASGMPEFWCMVKGRKIYDHRDGGHSATNEATWEWSQNWALHMVDWARGVPMRNGAGTIVRNYGLRAADAEIDYTAADEAANISDESVVRADASTEPRYASNGALPVSTKAADGFEAIKSGGFGDVVCAGGLWIIRAGAYRTPTVTIDEDDFRGPITGLRVKPPRRELCNVVKGVYVSAENNYLPSDFPPVRNSTYKTEDGGEDLPFDIELPFTTSHATAQRIAKMILEESRQPYTFTAPLKIVGMQNIVTDVVNVNVSRMGWSSKPFRVQVFGFVAENDSNGKLDFGVNLQLRETAAGIYDWADGEETTVDLAPNTTLPSAFNVATPGTPTLASGTANAFQQADGYWMPRLKVTHVAPTDTYVLEGGRVSYEYKNSGSGTWLPAGQVRGDVTENYILDVRIGQTYDVRIQFINSNGVRSPYSATASHTVTGDGTAPAAPSGLVATAGTGKAVSLDWTDNTEPDLGEYKVFRNTSNNSGTATEIAEVRASRFVDTEVTLAQIYYYWIKATDRSENVSGFSTGASATPGVIGSGSVDLTAPSTPNPPSVASTAVYQAGDGNSMARASITMPAMPSGAELLNLKYRRDGSSGWIVADQTDTGGGTSTLDDLTPGVDYEIACDAISPFGILSSLSTVVDFTAPVKTATPSTPASFAVDAAGTHIDAKLTGGAGKERTTAVEVGWTQPTDKDIDRVQYRRTDGSTPGAPSIVLSFESVLQEGYIPARQNHLVFYRRGSGTEGYAHIRYVDKTGNLSAWASVDLTAAFNTFVGSIAEDDKDDVNVSGIKSGDLSASDVQKVLTRYPGSTSGTMTGGANFEKVNVDLTDRGFSTKPDSASVEINQPGYGYVAYYDKLDAGTTSTNAVVFIWRPDGTNIPGSTAYDLNFIFEEFD